MKKSKSVKMLACAAGIMMSTAGAIAQLAPNVPDAPAKSPAYTPPPAAPAPAPAAPTPPPATAAAPVATPDLVQRDSSGKIIRLTIPTEEAAMAKLELDPDTLEKRMQIFMERRAYQDQLIVKYPAESLNLRNVSLNANKIEDLDVFVKVRGGPMNKVLLSYKTLSTMLFEGGGITQPQQKAIFDSATAYNAACSKEVNSELKGRSIQLSGITHARNNIPRSCFEFNREFNRMLIDAAKLWPTKITTSADLVAKAGDTSAAVIAAKDDAARADAMAALLAKLTPEQMSTLLAEVATPLPANPLTKYELPGGNTGGVKLEPVPAPKFTRPQAPAGGEPKK